MATEDGSIEPGDNDKLQSPTRLPPKPAETRSTEAKPEEDESEDGSEDEEEEEEPRLKYAPLTKNVNSIYRNGDATSTFLVAGDKMIVGTHNGNIQVFALPSFNSVRVYHAHTASISSISISPYNPLLAGLRYETGGRLVPETAATTDKTPTSSPGPKGKQQQTQVPDIPPNRIYIATSSIDGNVCIASLVDPRDVQLRNFGRPVQTVALSPEYKSDRNYLSGGQAGTLVLTTGGQAGKSSNATTTGAAAAASGWLGSIGLGANTGSDRVLHSGEGIISTIKWSFSGKFVVWVNEQGIKIMRSDLKLESSEGHHEWKRISHIDRPNRPGWEDLAGVWKARAEWVTRDTLEVEDDSNVLAPASNGEAPKPDLKVPKHEEILVGWGDSAWLVNVYPGSTNAKGNNKIGRAEVATIIRFDDCTISGISLYTPHLLLVLAYVQKAGNGSATQEAAGSNKGRRARQNALQPELRLIDINTKEEVETDTLLVSRYETLSAADYHLGILPPVRIPAALVEKGYLSTIGSGMTTVGSTLVTGVGTVSSGLVTGVGTVGSGLVTGVETVGQGVWDATMYGPRLLGANRIFSGPESVRSGNSGPGALERTGSSRGGLERMGSTRDRNFLTGWIPGFGSSEANAKEEMNTIATAQSMKIFIYSPYDCIVAIRRNLYDRMQWLVEKKRYQKAWELVDQHPEAAGTLSLSSETPTPSSPSKASSVARSGSAAPSTPTQARQQATLAEFFTDSASLASSSQEKSKNKFSAAEKDKRRIGELWLKQLVDAKDWTGAAEVAARVLNTTSRWEHWAWVFIRNKKFDEISPHIPTLDLTPPLTSSVFEIILGHYLESDKLRFKELLDDWPSDLFDIGSITTAIQDQIRLGGAPRGSQEWRILEESLAKLFLADGHYDEALKCYISLQDADTALTLIKENHLIGAIADDIPSFVTLRISSNQLKSASREELDELATDPIRLLVDEAAAGVVEPDEVVSQLDTPALRPFLYFYLRALWRGEGTQEESGLPRVGHSAAATNLAADTGKQQVDYFADAAVDLFAEYDQTLLLEFLQASTAYTFEKAVQVCEKKHYVEELVFLLSKTGQTKKALFLIIDELKDVSKAITFAKEQDDRSLWDDFLEYSMSRPKFISGLLAGVGTAIDPITLVKRIPSGLEVEGLKDGLKKMIREYDLQDSISSGVARVLSSEVAVGMESLRRGRRKGIRFDVVSKASRARRPLERLDTNARINGTSEKRMENQPAEIEMAADIKPGHCASCHRAFHENESETLVGFACGHVYHISHLLHGPDAEGDEVLLPRSAARQDDEDDMDFSRISRAVGPKVTNARLLKDKIQNAGGCTICKATREKLKEVGG